jgi:flavin reductase (DIM6/NTAB) family NADH-FMN oxidoreductase RutF
MDALDTTMADEHPIDPALVRRRTMPPDPVAEALELFPYGVYVIGSRSAQGERNGMIADWVLQVSFQPRLVLCSFENDATTLQNVRETGAFTVNLLPEGGQEIARAFVQPRDASKVKGRDEEEGPKVYHKLAAVPHYVTEETGCPVLEEALAWVECRLHQLVPAGDHTLAIGEVVDGGVLRFGEPLTQRALGWSYAG